MLVVYLREAQLSKWTVLAQCDQGPNKVSTEIKGIERRNLTLRLGAYGCCLDKRPQHAFQNRYFSCASKEKKCIQNHKCDKKPLRGKTRDMKTLSNPYAFIQ